MPQGQPALLSTGCLRWGRKWELERSGLAESWPRSIVGVVVRHQSINKEEQIVAADFRQASTPVLRSADTPPGLRPPPRSPRTPRRVSCGRRSFGSLDIVKGEIHPISDREMCTRWPERVAI